MHKDALYVKLDKGLHQKLRHQAKQERRTKSEVVRRAISDYLIAHESQTDTQQETQDDERIGAVCNSSV